MFSAIFPEKEWYYIINMFQKNLYYIHLWVYMVFICLFKQEQSSCFAHTWTKCAEIRCTSEKIWKNYLHQHVDTKGKTFTLRYQIKWPLLTVEWQFRFFVTLSFSRFYFYATYQSIVSTHISSYLKTYS